MVQNERNFGGRGIVAEASTEGFKVFRMPRSDRGVARGPRKVKRVKASKAKRGPGRPRVYDGQDRRIIAAALRKYGYTHGLKFLRKERKLKISKTVARAVAAEVGLTFKRGRPAA
jgi:transposase